MERRLAVIVSADLVGFTRFMEKDEAGTWEYLRDLRASLIDPTLGGYGGNIFKTTGDGMLVEFANSVDAVRSVVEIQSAVHELNRGEEVENRREFRVGVHMGDVIVDDGDLFGDAVNVAARLQGACEPGGVCVSGVVFNSTHRNADIPFECIGQIELRNRSEPVEGFVWRYGAERIVDGKPWRPPSRVKLMAGHTKRPIETPVKSTGMPSIAVLPLLNLSNDDELGFVATGLAEDVTTELYRFTGIAVISRTSAFMCAQENRTAREIGTELGVRYILEGSVRRLGSKIRINVQLIDIEADDHIWAEKFDADTSEIFEVHDQIVSKIVATIGDGIDRKRLQDTRHLAPADLEAYELMLRGLDLHKQGYVSYEKAVEIHDLFSQAVEKDPDFPRARAWRVCAGSRLWPVHATPEQMQALFDEALGELDQVLKLNSEEPEAHRIYGSLSMGRGDFEKGRIHTEKALSLNPNNSHVLAKSANFYTFYGEPQKAFELLDRARMLNPHFPDWYWQEYGLAHWTAGQYEDAIANLTKSAALTDIDFGFLAASQAALGEIDSARESFRQLEAIIPGITPELFVSRQPFRSETHRTRLKEQLESIGA